MSKKVLARLQARFADKILAVDSFCGDDEATVAHAARQIANDTQQALLHFEALKRLLDREEPGWRRLAA